MHGSLASKSGVEDDDYIIEFNGRKIFDLTDIRLSLLYAEKGKTYPMSVRRVMIGKKLSVTFDE